MIHRRHMQPMRVSRPLQKLCASFLLLATATLNRIERLVDLFFSLFCHAAALEFIDDEGFDAHDEFVNIQITEMTLVFELFGSVIEGAEQIDRTFTLLAKGKQLIKLWAGLAVLSVRQAHDRRDK